jgi:hypothetical protein
LILLWIEKIERILLNKMNLKIQRMHFEGIMELGQGLEENDEEYLIHRFFLSYQKAIFLVL